MTRGFGRWRAVGRWGGGGKSGAKVPHSKGHGSVRRGVLTDTHGLLCGAGVVSSLGGAEPCDWKGNDNDQRHGP